MQVDGDGQTVVKSNEKPQQMGLFKGDVENERDKFGPTQERQADDEVWMRCIRR